MAKEEHHLKMKVLKLKEWMLLHKCTNMGIDLPQGYEVEGREDGKSYTIL